LRIGLISFDWNARSIVGLSVSVTIGLEATSGCCIMRKPSRLGIEL
jgi:hypothetical protein